MAITAIIKDPNSTLDYSFDWSDFLAGQDGGPNDTIADVEWTVPAAISYSELSNTTTAATIWLEGLTDTGVLGQEYYLKCTVTTAGGRISDFTVPVTIRAVSYYA